MLTKAIITNEAYRLEYNYKNVSPKELTSVIMAKNDRAACQLILQSDKHYSVSLSRGDWYSDFEKVAAGKALSGHDRFRVAVNSSLKINMHHIGMFFDDDETKKADILLDQDVVETYANMPASVWIEFESDKNTRAGEYGAEIKVYHSLYGEDEKEVASFNVTVKVYDVLLDDSQSWKFHLDLWQHHCNLARHGDVRLWSDEHYELMKPYAKSMAELGQKAVSVCVSEIPWGGQLCELDHRYGGNLFEYSSVFVTKKLDGSFEYDFSKMQRIIDTYSEAGVDKTIEVFGLVNLWGVKGYPTGKPTDEYPENIKIRYLDESDGAQKYLRSGEDIIAYVKALEKYFIDTKQIDKVRIAADEPADPERYRKSLDMLKSIAPSFRGSCAINHAEFIGQFYDRIDDFVPYLGCTVQEYDRLQEYKAAYPEKRFLWYVCCNREMKPNTFISSHPIESRTIGLMTSFFGFDGFARWAYTIWSEDPRKDVRHSAFEAGDTCFVYPGYNGKPLLSLRYKNLQRGISDFELLARYRDKYGDEMTDALLKKVLIFEDIRTYVNNGKCRHESELFSVDFDDYNAIKEEVLKGLE